MSDREHFYPAAAVIDRNPPEPEEILVIFRGDDLVLDTDGSLPRGGDWCRGVERKRLILGRIGRVRCSLLEWGGGGRDGGGENEVAEMEDLPENFRVQNLRSALLQLPFEARIAVCRGRELAYWRRNRHFCGRCGSELEDLVEECARRCPSCGTVFYPTLSPAVIVAVTSEDGRLLLAHNRKFRDGMYSLIAGFVEPGETMEEAVRREVAEEVGLSVRNIRYFGSQSWPYPNSLMAGFTAEYAGGEVHPDGVEISDAGFFTPESAPELPSPGSIARTMIDHWIANYGKRIHE